MESSNPVYEDVDEYEVQLQNNASYATADNAAPENKCKCSKKAVLAIGFAFATLVLPLGAVLASTIHALSEIAELKSDIATTNQAVLQQSSAFSLMLESAQMNISLEVMMYQQLVRDLEDRVQQNFSNLMSNIVETLNQDFSNVTAAIIEARIAQQNSWITQVHNFSQNAAQQSAAYLSTLQEQSAQNDSVLNTRLNDLITAYQQLNNSISGIVDSILGQISNSCDTLPTYLVADYYYILSSNGSAVRQYCPSITTRCGQTGRWRSVANLDMTNSTHQCLNDLTQRTYSNKRSCVRSNYTGGCSSVQLPTTTAYRSVCGLVRAYQFGTPDAFFPSEYTSSIDSHYVDGVSITYGSPRQHIWTFAAASSESSYREGCSCMGGSNSRPAFVGNDYFCDTGTSTGTGPVFYGDDPLWDGAGCGPTNNCCSFNTPPWFYKKLPQYSNNSIELRLCRDQHHGDENIALEAIAIFVK